jgi:hypothetical protein
MESSTINEQDLTYRAKLGNWQIALLILIAGLILTLVATILLKHDEEVQARNEFNLISREIRTRIERRLNSHALLLRNGASFFTASDSVSRHEWKIFIENSHLDKLLPGIEGVGFSYIVYKNDLQKHIDKVRGEGFPDYTIIPDESSKDGRRKEPYNKGLYIEVNGDKVIIKGRNMKEKQWIFTKEINLNVV